MVSSKMNISLRRGERLFINGAVIRVNRKVCIELLNDVTFLLEHHIIQPEEAVTPIQQLYIAIQTILMAPAEREKSLLISLDLLKSIQLLSGDNFVISSMKEVQIYLEMNKPLEALKSLRSLLNVYRLHTLEDDNHRKIHQLDQRR